MSFQILAIGVAFAFFAVWPPANGSLLLIPFDGSTQGEVANIALAGGAALLGSGSTPNSLVVSGNRYDIAEQLTGHGILILAANRITCGRTARS